MDAATLLLQARQGHGAAPWRDVQPADRAGAYAVQDHTVARLGPVGGWKVGAPGPQAEPTAAPLPAAGLLPAGVRLAGPAWALRVVEVEVALRVARDLAPAERLADAAAWPSLFDAVMPAVEVVETRLQGWPEADALAKLADLQSHGALVVGTPLPMPPGGVDLRLVQATLSFDGNEVAHTTGGNPAADLGRLIAWLVDHAAARGLPLRKGQIVTTGSCTGMKPAPAGTNVQATVLGLGSLGLRFGD